MGVFWCPRSIYSVRFSIFPQKYRENGSWSEKCKFSELSPTCTESSQPWYHSIRLEQTSRLVYRTCHFSSNLVALGPKNWFRGYTSSWTMASSKKFYERPTSRNTIFRICTIFYIRKVENVWDKRSCRHPNKAIFIIFHKICLPVVQTVFFVK